MIIVLIFFILIDLLTLYTLIYNIIKYMKIKNCTEIVAKLECKTNLYSEQYFKYFPEEKEILGNRLEKYNNIVDKINKIPKSPIAVSKKGNTLRISKNNTQNIEHETLRSDVKTCIYSYKIDGKIHFIKTEKGDGMFSEKDFGTKEKKFHFTEEKGQKKFANKDEIIKNIKSATAGFILISAIALIIYGIVG